MSVPPAVAKLFAWQISQVFSFSIRIDNIEHMRDMNGSLTMLIINKLSAVGRHRKATAGLMGR